MRLPELFDGLRPKTLQIPLVRFKMVLLQFGQTFARPDEIFRGEDFVACAKADVL
jgi:hypothetical protein